MDYKLIALDMDGTLLNDKKKLQIKIKKPFLRLPLKV
jgi:Predicted hydrolases of the HAD superfamily